MYATFCFEIPIGISTFYKKCSAFYSSSISRLIVEHFYLVSVSFPIPEIHSKKHLSPILCLCSTCACIDRNYGVLFVILIAEHSFKFHALDFAFDIGDFYLSLFCRFFILLFRG